MSDDYAPFTVVLSGEVAYKIREIAEKKKVKPQVVAREFVTDGMKQWKALPDWWRRGKMSI